MWVIWLSSKKWAGLLGAAVCAACVLPERAWQAHTHPRGKATMACAACVWLLPPAHGLCRMRVASAPCVWL